MLLTDGDPISYKKPSFRGGGGAASRKLVGLQGLVIYMERGASTSAPKPTWDVAGLHGPQILLQGTWRCARLGMMRRTCGIKV